MKSSKLSLVVSLLMGGLIGSVFAHRFLPVTSEAEKEYSRGEVDRRQATVVTFENVVAEPVEVVGGIETLDERYVVANSYRSKRRRAWELERLFEGMSAAEASAIFIKIMDTPEYSKPGSLIAPFFRAWGGVDGASALAAAKGLEGNAAKDAYKHLFPAWANSDVHAAWEAAQANQSLPRSYDWYWPVKKEMAKQDPEALLQLANQGDASDVVGALVHAADETGEFTSLLERLGRLENPEKRDQAMQNALRAWAAKAPEGALRYLESIENPDEADKAMSSYLAGWAVSNRAATLDYIFENLATAAVERSMNGVFEVAMVKGSKDENLELIKRLSDAGLIEKVGPGAVRALAMRQPDIATRLDDSLARDELGDGLESQDQMRSMMGPMASWVRSDFDGAYSYYQEVESEELKLKHLPALVNGIYGRSDGGTLAVSLIESVPRGTERTVVVEEMLQRAASGHNRASPDFLVGLELITESETALSERAEAAREKLFGPKK